MRKNSYFIIALILFFSLSITVYSKENISNDNVIVQYSLENKDLAKYIVKNFYKITTTTLSKFKLKYDHKVTIILSDNKNEFNKKISNSKNLNIQAVAIGKSNLIIINTKSINFGEKNNLKNLLEHELSHLILRNNIIENSDDVKLPRWFNEGVAMFISEGFNELYSNSYNNFLNISFIKKEVIPFSYLNYGFPIEQNLLSQSYAQSISMVEFLVNKYGQDKLFELIRELSESKESFFISFYKIYKIPFHDLESLWLLKKEKTYDISSFIGANINILINFFIGFLAIIAFLVSFIKNKHKKKIFFEDVDSKN